MTTRTEDRHLHTSRDTETDLDLVVAVREEAADGVVVLTLRDPAAGALPAWAPGAHVDLVLGSDLVRQYSLCGDPADRGAYRVAVLREQDGRGGSAHVHERLVAGTPVHVRGPRNAFPLVPSPRYLFLAGGIGITPLLPMVAAADAAGADWRLVYGGRSRASMAFRDELPARYGDRVQLAPQDEVGLLDLAGLLGTPQAGTAVYCCGPEPLLQAVEQHCADWAPGALHVERFAPRAQEAPVLATSFEVELQLSGRTVTVRPDQSVLEAVEAAGVPVLSSCQEGTCGTCETPVLEGEVDHRDSLLSPQEQAASETMMICVSRAACPRLVLEL